MTKYIRFMLAFMLVFMSACKSDDDDDNGGGDTPVSGDTYYTQCGIVHEGMVKNPIAKEEGRAVQVEITDYNLAIATLPEGQVLIKLQGIENVYDSTFKNLIKNKLTEIAGDGQAIFYQAMPDCAVTTSGGGVAAVGSLVTIDGRSYVEELLKTGLVEADSYDNCGGNLIGECLEEIEESGTQYSDEIVSDFLWKPVSDKDGKLTVLLNPYGATIYVNGIKLADSGSGNGRGTIARGSMPGCSYGGNVQVRVYDEDGAIILFPDGSDTYIISNGCSRVEF